MGLKDHYGSVLSLLLILAVFTTLAAADVNRDSLIQALKKAPEKSLQRAEILQQLNESYREDIPDESIYYGRKLIPLAASLNAKELLYKGYMATGVAYAVRGDAPDTALQHFLKALDIAKAESGKQWELNQVKSRINLAGVHWQLENLKSALDYAYQNVAQLEAMEEPLTLADAYRTVALMHRSAENYDSTFIYLGRALEIYEAEQAHHRKAFTLMTMGVTYQKRGLFEQAQRVLYQAQGHARLHQDSILLRDTYEGLANTHLQRNELDSAEYYARALLNVARRKNLIPETATAYELLSALFSVAGRPDSALYYYRRYAESREQLIGEEKVKAIEEMDTRYQAKEKARENQLLRKQNALANFRNSLLLASSFMFLALVGLIAYFNYRLRRRKAELEELYEEVSMANTRLMAVMNEKKHMVSLIAHDIRNPLSLIQLNAHALDADTGLDEAERKQLLEEVEQAAADIDRASLKIMEVESNTEARAPYQNFSFDLVQILKESIHEFSAFARSKSISLQAHFGQPKGVIKGDPFLLRHIVANLLSNAIKYSPPKEEVKLLFSTQNGQVSFSVEDNGPGLSIREQKHLFQKGKTFHSGPEGSHSRGEGLYLTRRYVEAMGGTVTVKSEVGKGALFTVSFPAAPESAS